MNHRRGCTRRDRLPSRVTGRRHHGDALPFDALLAGREVKDPETKAVGCFLPTPKDVAPAAAPGVSGTPPEPGIAPLELDAAPPEPDSPPVPGPLSVRAEQAAKPNANDAVSARRRGARVAKWGNMRALPQGSEIVTVTCFVTKPHSSLSTVTSSVASCWFSW